MNFSEKISEARRIGQTSRLMEPGSWYSKYFVRNFSIYISYFFWKLDISANTLTVASGLAGVMGSLCIVFDNVWLTVAGAALWQVWFILDDVDGEVARLRRQVSLFGVYLDRLTHIFVNPTLSLSFGLHVYLKEQSPVNLISAIVLYSVFTWTKQVKLVPIEGLGIKGGTEQKGVTKYRFDSKSAVCWVRFIVVECFKEIGQMWLFPTVIILDRVIKYEVTSRFLYAYTILLLGYVVVLILRDARGIRQLDSGNASAVSHSLEE